MTKEIDRVLRDFLVESQENLEQLDHEFVALVEHDPDNTELLNDIFRTIHTIKGRAGFLNLIHLEQIAHCTENVLAKLRDHSLTLTPGIITTLLCAVDAIKSILLLLEEIGAEGELKIQEILMELKQAAEGRRQKAAWFQTAVSSAAETPEICQDIASPVPGAMLHAEFHGDSSSHAMENNNTTVLHDPGLPEQGNHVITPVEDQRIHVDVGILDQLMNLTGELVLARNRVVQFTTVEEINRQQFRTAGQRLHVIVSELQETMMKTRMQSVNQVFGMLPRLARDVSQAHGKVVELHLKGQQTELDRTLLEALKDPLTHLVRNAIDHGIETPEVRKAQGKPPAGTIVIHAYHEGGQVHIEVRDDGAGLNFEQIKAKALQEGLVSSEHMETMSARELRYLIFRPGFSTSTSVTDMSGRGVGMDVVKRNLDRIGGTVELHSERDQGTTVTLHIPMTLAIIPGLIVRAADQRFVIPQGHLEELVMLRGGNGKHGGIETVYGSEVYRLRGELLPLLRLDRIFKLLSQEQARQDDTNIVVVSNGTVRFGLIVDEVEKTEEIVVKPLDPHLKHVSCYDGATIMGDGNIALILNVNGLSAAAQVNLEDVQTAVEQQTTLNRDDQPVLAVQEDWQTIVLFRAGPNEYYGVPLAFVTRLEEIQAARVETSGGREVLQYRGEILPLIRLEPYLNLPQAPEQKTLALIVFSVEKPVGLVVSEVLNTVEISTHIDTETFKQKGILGSTIVQSHSVLIVDIHGLIEKAYPNWYKQFFMSRLNEAAREQISVLLVEDSQFFLNIEKSYLESAGYQVITAGHGNEALNILEGQPVDVVVTDIDMPYCNGHELARRIKSSDQWRHIPVMAVTALSGEEDRKKGLESGIDEYKIKLDRDDVLRALEQLILRNRKNA